MNRRALVLFAHGARDPRWAAPFQQLEQIVQARLSDVSVSLAFLELMSPRLPEVVQQLAKDGVTDITVVPIFFGQGGHVLRDLPAMIEELRATYPELMLKSATAVGESPDVLNAIAGYCVGTLDHS